MTTNDETMEPSESIGGNRDHISDDDEHLPSRSIGPWRIPFMTQTSAMDCGPTALAMALGFYTQAEGQDEPLSSVMKQVSQTIYGEGTSKNGQDVRNNTAITSLRLALAAKKIMSANTSASFSLKDVLFYSTSLTLDPSNMELPFYYNFADIQTLDESNKLLEEAKSAGIILHERCISLSEILDFLRMQRVAIVLVDMNVIYSILEGRPYQGFTGHFLVIAGYDADTRSVIVHNCDRCNGQMYAEVDIDVFDKARVATGTDVDTIILVPEDKGAAAISDERRNHSPRNQLD